MKGLSQKLGTGPSESGVRQFAQKRAVTVFNLQPPALSSKADSLKCLVGDVGATHIPLASLRSPKSENRKRELMGSSAGIWHTDTSNTRIRLRFSTECQAVDWHSAHTISISPRSLSHVNSHLTENTRHGSRPPRSIRRKNEPALCSSMQNLSPNPRSHIGRQSS